MVSLLPLSLKLIFKIFETLLSECQLDLVRIVGLWRALAFMVLVPRARTVFLLEICPQPSDLILQILKCTRHLLFASTATDLWALLLRAQNWSAIVVQVTGVVDCHIGGGRVTL